MNPINGHLNGLPSPGMLANRYLFTDGLSVPLFDFLANAGRRPDCLDNDTQEYFDFVKDACATSQAWVGHVLDPERANTKDYARSNSRIRKYSDWLHQIYGWMRRSPGNDLSWEPSSFDPTIPWERSAAWELGALCGAVPGRDQALAAGKSVTVQVALIPPAIAKDQNACLVPLRVDLIERPACESGERLTHFGSGLNAFLWFDESWLESFDHALEAGAAYAGALCDGNTDPSTLGQGMAVRWCLLLNGFFNTSRFDDIEQARRVPFDGSSASASYAAAVAKLLARHVIER